MNTRRSGILLHITSLPSRFGIGDLGPAAYHFVDFLTQTRQSLWQILPLNPTDIMYGNSPYSSHSAFAGNPLLISPELLVQEGLLQDSDLAEAPPFPRHEVDYANVIPYKMKLLARAYENFKHRNGEHYELQNFCRDNAWWLEDYALFIALREHFNGSLWGDWPWELRTRQEHVLREVRENSHDRIAMERFIQFIFFRQWHRLKSHCNAKNIHLIGDIPIYVNYDSADVWSHPHLFKLDEQRKPRLISGVPPDYFSATGQLWGSPVYEWETLRATRYAWWLQRLDQNFKLCDLVRLDHFRGFMAYWEIPAHETTAINGRWIEAPGWDFFNTLARHYPHLPIIAEDLGVITPDVREVMQHFGFPGMKLLMFAFSSDTNNVHHGAPHTYVRNSIVYTGTHDNNTVKAWFHSEASAEERQKLAEYLGHELREEEITWDLIRLGMMSVAKMIVVPMQDLLGLGGEARMNMPATVQGNWKWRLQPEQLEPGFMHRIAELTRIYGRA